MTTKATGTFEVKSWDEKRCDEAEGVGQLVRVRAVYTNQGEMEGERTSETVMTHQEGGSITHFVSIERFAGRLGGKSGSFMLQGHGTYNSDQGARSEFSVVPGSGTGELTGLRGNGSYIANQPPFSIELTYDFE